MVFNFNKNGPTTIDVFCIPICNKYVPIGINSMKQYNNNSTMAVIRQISFKGGS